MKIRFVLVALLAGLTASGCSVAVGPQVDKLSEQITGDGQPFAAMRNVQSNHEAGSDESAEGTADNFDVDVDYGVSLADIVVMHTREPKLMAEFDNDNSMAAMDDENFEGTGPEGIAQTSRQRLRDDPDEWVRDALAPIFTGRLRAAASDSDQEGALEIPGVVVEIAKLLMQARDRSLATGGHAATFSVGDFDELSSFVEEGQFAAANSLQAFQRTKSARFVDRLRADGDQVSSPQAALLLYSKAYYKGDFVNRFGRKIALPEIKNSLPNEAIAGGVEVLVEFLADYLLETKLYERRVGEGQGFCGAENKPTAARWALIKRGEWVDAEAGEDDTDKMTSTKCAIVNYGANAIGENIARWSGGVLDSLGGFDVGIAVAGFEFSAGDNDTLSTLAKTALRTAARRYAEHLLIRVTLNIDTGQIAEEWCKVFREGDDECGGDDDDASVSG